MQSILAPSVGSRSHNCVRPFLSGRAQTPADLIAWHRSLELCARLIVVITHFAEASAYFTERRGGSVRSPKSKAQATSMRSRLAAQWA
jgi:hypothetical protein